MVGSVLVHCVSNRLDSQVSPSRMEQELAIKLVLDPLIFMFSRSGSLPVHSCKFT